MKQGYVYCFSNKSMPGLLKIGMTKKSPVERLKDANSTDTWRPPDPYVIDFAKFVNEPKIKEKLLHKILAQYTERVNPKREFFRVPVIEVLTLFELMDGDMWSLEPEKIDQKEDIQDSRDITKCFYDTQIIRHMIDDDKIWIGIYSDEKKAIICDNKPYSLEQFVKMHYEIDCPDKISSLTDAWEECECEIYDNTWVSTNNIQKK